MCIVNDTDHRWASFLTQLPIQRQQELHRLQRYHYRGIKALYCYRGKETLPSVTSLQRITMLLSLRYCNGTITKLVHFAKIAERSLVGNTGADCFYH
jgi:hypothetical protein